MNTPPSPRLSVLIGTYNYGTFIEEAVESVLQQTIPRSDVEIIVVDDGSTDDTRTRLERYGDAIQYIYQANGGQASALNLGLARSRGELIAFLDADDVWYPDKLEQVVSEFDSSPEIDVVSHLMTVVDSHGTAIGETPEHRLASEAANQQPLRSCLQGTAPPIMPPTSGIAVRSACLARITPIPESYRICADHYLIRMLPLCARKFAFLQRPLASYRVHGQNSWIGRPPSAEQTEAFIDLIRLSWGYVKNSMDEHGYDSGPLSKRFESEIHEAQTELYVLRHQRLKAMRHAWQFESPESQTSGQRAFRRLTKMLGVLMPRAVYHWLRDSYRESRIFSFVHRHEDR